MTATYEEQFGPFRRRALRVCRGVRWYVKRALGMRRGILVEVCWRLGDEIMAIPIYEALRTRWRDARITVLCNYPDLLVDNPFVDAINVEDPAPDRYVLLRSGPRTAVRVEHYARCAGVPTPKTPPRLYYADWTAPPLGWLPQGDGPLVAVSSGASWPTKRWAIDRWRALCRALEGLGCRIVELGVAQDDPIGVGTSLVGGTTVREAACVLRASAMLVCCDSGPMHLALAAGTRVLALFGPTDPAILIRDDPNLAAVKADRDCQGCWNRSEETETPGVCPLGRTTCLDSIPVDDVLARVRVLLGLGD